MFNLVFERDEPLGLYDEETVFVSVIMMQAFGVLKTRRWLVISV